MNEEQIKAMKLLDNALCNFLNGASDAWLPSEWAKETERNFKELCESYNLAHKKKCFPKWETGGK